MPYSANQYNYATPLASSAQLTSARVNVADVKYITLHDNVLDGTYHPVSGDVGLWGSSISDDNGLLPEPYEVTVTDGASVNAVRIVGSSDSYPVDFTIKLYSGDTLLHTVTEYGNNEVEYVHYLGDTFDITHYVITITRISRSNAVARLYNTYNPVYVARSERAAIRVAEARAIATEDYVHLKRVDTPIISCKCNSAIRNIISTTHGTLKVHATDASIVTNVHTRMKDPSRRIYGKVYITYSDPMLDNETTIVSSGEAHNSRSEQLSDSIQTSNGPFFTLYDNDLSGAYPVMSEESQVGWVSDAISDASGNFAEAPYLRISFSTRPITPLTVHFDDSHGSVAEDFSVVFGISDGSTVVKNITGNTSAAVLINTEAIADVEYLLLTFNKTSKPYMPIAVLDVPVASVFLYEGYENTSKLVSIDLLEELTYDDSVEALGGISANEVTVVLDNSDAAFYINSSSVVSGQLKRNRKIEPWLGVEIVPGEIEWYKQGVYWSYRWNVPVKGLVANVTGFDTIGLLGITDFTSHTTQRNKSIGELIDYVLTNAKQSLSFLEWKVHPDLYSVVVPYAWFAASSHAAALRKISQAYPMHVYCDKNGVICAAPQKVRYDFFYDTWSDSTNVINKEYNSLFTTVPNIVTVNVKIPHEDTNSTLVSDNLVFNVATVPTRTLNFSSPYLSDIVVTVDKDASVSYTYAVYSWGIEFAFTGSGNVRSIVCNGTSLNVSNTSSLTRRDAESIRLNGAINRDVSADFIQTSELASLIIDRIFDLSEYDRYDATVTYRGDIALSINDPVCLLNGIAPVNTYNIRRHKLSWNGALSGTADLNT